MYNRIIFSWLEVNIKNVWSMYNFPRLIVIHDIILMYFFNVPYHIYLWRHLNLFQIMLFVAVSGGGCWMHRERYDFKNKKAEIKTVSRYVMRGRCL